MNKLPPLLLIDCDPDELQYMSILLEILGHQSISSLLYCQKFSRFEKTAKFSELIFAFDPN